MSASKKHAQEEIKRIVAKLLEERMAAEPHERHFGIRITRDYSEMRPAVTVTIIVGLDGHLYHNACPPGQTYWVHR